MDPIHPQIIEIALDRAGGAEFESFVNNFLPALVGHKYKPLGGTKDGGADGLEEPIHEKVDSTSVFYQASIQKEYLTKIEGTVTRLFNFGREPSILHYITNQEIRYHDQVEDDLTEELGVTIRIKDRKYIASHINHSDQTKMAFEANLRHYTDYLKTVGASKLISASAHVKNPEIYIFLSQEMERRGGNSDTISGVVDSLILWALEGTNPDAGILYSEKDITQKIEGVLPSVSSMISFKIRPRLQSLASGNRDSRRVRWHRKEDAFCLPWESRRFIEEDNREDETIRLEMQSSIVKRISDYSPNITDRRRSMCESVVTGAIQLIFEREGLSFVASIENGSNPMKDLTVADAVRTALDSCEELKKDEVRSVGEISFSVLRGILNNSTDQERTYLARLIRTYSLLFTLNRQPRLLEYFQDMAGDYYLYVGADQLILSLSERYLPEGDRAMTNTLKAAARVGATLVLTETAISEVVHNLRSSDREYMDSFASLPGPIPFDMARNSPKILVRSFLYANLEKDRLGSKWPASWQNFVTKICQYPLLHKPESFDFVRRNLQAMFAMDYRTTQDLEKLVDNDELNDLTGSLMDIKKGSYELARNDALMALSVYGHRRKEKEDSTVSEFGYKTWWLTNEFKIINETEDLISKHHGSTYIMRPAYLLNFLTLAPAAEEARRSFGSLFPSHLGMRLSRRMPQNSFHKLIEKVKEAENMDESERIAAMAHCSDVMRGDFSKQYDSSFDRGLDSIAEDLIQ